MTIAAAYLTSEGVVLGTDSAVTISTAEGAVVQVLNHVQKVFEVGERSRLGVCTWGAGSIEGTSHRTLVARLADRIDPESTTVGEAARIFAEIVSASYGDGANTGDVGYALGGWDPSARSPDCYRLVFRPQVGTQISGFNIGQAQFFGNPEFFTRVFHGYDTRLPGRILTELQNSSLNIPEEQLVNVFQTAFSAAIDPLRAIGFSDLAIREAIDFIHMYLHVTIKAFKFRSGVPICGGPIEIAFITTDRTFRWARHKTHDSALYEVEGKHAGP